jgi:hypothetical protein
LGFFIVGNLRFLFRCWWFFHNNVVLSDAAGKVFAFWDAAAVGRQEHSLSAPQLNVGVGNREPFEYFRQPEPNLPPDAIGAQNAFRPQSPHGELAATQKACQLFCG